MAITLRRPVRVTPEVVDTPEAKTAAGHAFQWAGSRVDVESLLRLKTDWYPRVQHYARTIGIFGAALREMAQTIADLEWSPDDKLFGQRPNPTDDPRWDRLAASVDTLDWFRAAHQVCGPGVVHIAAWPDPDTVVRLEAFSLSELTPPLSGHPDAAPMVMRFEGDMLRPLFDPGSDPRTRPRIVTVFRPDGEWGQSVWTPAQSCLDDFEALLLMSIADKAYDLHRVAGAGILFIPNSLAQVELVTEGKAKSLLDAPAVKSIIKTITAPMADPYAPERVVPAIITGPDDAGAKIKHLLLERTTDPDAYVKRRDARWRNIAVALDQPAGRVLNSEDQSKFYNSQAIDFFSMRSTVGIARLISDALMKDLFRPIMREQWGDKHWRRRILTPSWDHLQPEPDKTDEALRLLDAGIVTPSHAQDMAKIPEEGRVELGSLEWRQLLEWRAALNPAMAGFAAAPAADPAGAAVPPSTGPAAPGTSPDGAAAPDPLAGFDATLASARLAAMGRDLVAARKQIEAKTAAGQDHSGGVMVALMLAPDVARSVAIPGGEAVEDLHVTVAYLGNTADLDRAAIEQALATVTSAPLSGTIGGIGRFPTSHKEGLQAVWVPVDVPGLNELHDAVVSALADVGVQQGSVHGYTPHVTLDYVTPDQPSPPPVPQAAVSWAAFTLAWDNDRVEFPFNATEPMPAQTAAAASSHPLQAVAPALNRIDADTRARIAGAAEHAMRAAMRKCGVKIANKANADARRATADLAATPWLIPARLGPAVCAAILGPDDPLDGAFDDLGDSTDEILAAAVLAALLALKVSATSDAGAAALAKAATARASAVDLLKSQMMDLARTRIFKPDTTETRGEAVSGLVPAGIPGRTVAVAGGAPVETVEGVTRLAAAETPAAGVATGPIVLETTATLSVDPFTVNYQWMASNAANPFPPHHALDGVTVTKLTDPKLAAGAGAEWMQIGSLYPGDHQGCGCSWSISFVAGAS